MTAHQPIHVLFLCSHNAARSQMAEAILNHMGGSRFRAWSAGREPRPDGQPHPLALEALHSAGIDTAGLRSKSWDEFVVAEAPPLDLVITLCDQAAGEACPVWPGQPATAHWSYEDPSLVQAPHEEQLYAFKHVLHALHQRLELLMSLPLSRLDKFMLEHHARELAPRAR
ncbi:arsenate reductase ArsC [Aquabacterium sp. A08]|uniref:arsenate reductase ArsC n=1 Tax=Aquabacterium sp. A08 TaxID=2718532 RepID=UPI0014240FAD|nr:arsenate reductase ArsC [Aquabacterium sp. A08]NIC42338.1 arsenate reductase ArsC [Aquabacterium sp. A08]